MKTANWISRPTLAGATMLAVTFTPVALADERYAAIVIDATTNEVLHAENPDSERYPASLTKMMTLYLLFEQMEKGEVRRTDTIVASRRAEGQPPSKIYLKAGDALTVEQAIQALVTKSANDVAVAIAEHVSGSEARFATRMTARAQQLGMTSTRFANASGLPHPSQVTTARDIATLSQSLLRDFPQYYSYFQTSDFSWRKVYARNHNALLGRVEGVDGIKTGYTRASGFNLASSAVRDGRRIFAVVLGGETARARDNQMAHLIDMAFETLHDSQTPSPAITYTALPVTRVVVQPPAVSAESVATPTRGLYSVDVTVEQGDADHTSYVVPMPFAPLAPRATDVPATAGATELRGSSPVEAGSAQ